jgi:hypothetical protein
MRQNLATDPMALSSIIDVIHDCKFEVDKICFEAEKSTLKIDFFHENTGKKQVIWHFLLFKKYSTPIEIWTLMINHVRDYNYMQGDQVGPDTDDYFNALAYNEEKKELQISTVIGNGLIVKIFNLEVGIIASDTVVGMKTSYSIFS